MTHTTAFALDGDVSSRVDLPVRIATMGVRPTNLLRTSLLALVSLMLLASLCAPSSAQTFAVLYAFNNYDGSQPRAGLISDLAGNLYGTTQRGGRYDYGTVFKLDKTGVETVLHSFAAGLDGWYPEAPLLRDQSGNLYGTTTLGPSLGTVFKIDTAGKETVLYSFAGTPDAGFPLSGLIQDSSGNLYGTTVQGGVYSWGAVFKLDTQGVETVLKSFDLGAAGHYPYGNLLRDSAGNLYGTTAQGGDPVCNFSNGCGTVFKLDASGNHTVLHTFGTLTSDGQMPLSGLVADKIGNVYGTTYSGGAHGHGAVFKLSVGTKKGRILYSFNGGDGQFPSAALVLDTAGNLYGTTLEGGTYGFGSVFKVDATGHETVLYNFSGGIDGRYPVSSLLLDSSGNLYGTTRLGGRGYGVIFKITFQ